MDKKKIRNYLNEEDQKIFDQIENHELLGASNHIKVIGTMIENIAKSDRSNKDKKNHILELVKFYIKTRGKASHAIRNALRIMTHNLPIIDECDEAFSNKIVDEKNEFFKSQSKNLDKIIEYSVNLSKNYHKILLYDYSSTVEKFVLELSKDGLIREILLPESRIINGAYPYVKAFHLIDNLKLKFIPDCSLFYYMNNVEACFMGAETVYPDGTGFNTTGSDIVALICGHYHIPLYFITPMIKLDDRQLQGHQKKLVIDDLKEKLTTDWDPSINKEQIDFTTPELIGVSPQWISAFVTEYGVIPGDQMLTVALNYIKKMAVNNNE